MKRGDVYWVNFDPARGTEIQKRRPAVIVSNDAANRTLQRFQVVPLTSNTRRVYAAEALVTVAGHQSKAMTDQIMTVSRSRLEKRLGRITLADLRAVEQALRVQLGLS